MSNPVSVDESKSKEAVRDSEDPVNGVSRSASSAQERGRGALV